MIQVESEDSETYSQLFCNAFGLLDGTYRVFPVEFTQLFKLKI